MPPAPLALSPQALRLIAERAPTEMVRAQVTLAALNLVDTLAPQIEALGGSVRPGGCPPGYAVITLPIGALEALARLPGIIYVYPERVSVASG